MTVYELNRDQLIELKQSYMIELDDEGVIDEVLYGEETDRRGIYWSELADADELVPDDVIYEHYDGYYFSEDDFFCSMEVAI